MKKKDSLTDWNKKVLETKIHKDKKNCKHNILERSDKRYIRIKERQMD